MLLALSHMTRLASYPPVGPYLTQDEFALFNLLFCKTSLFHSPISFFLLVTIKKTIKGKSNSDMIKNKKVKERDVSCMKRQRIGWIIERSKMYTPTFISFLLYTFTKTNKQVFRGVSIIHNYSWIKKK